ncbi:hypothetical protein [Halomicronema hongdechloris]|nr:hypothetical protein [Halomicronema hongdechloris]
MTALPVQAASYYLDFDTDPLSNPITSSTVGDPYGISDQWSDWGVTLGATNKAGSRAEPLLLFNSNPDSYTGGDRDLRSGDPWGTAVQNNVLIIQEDGFRRNGTVKNAHDPDDEANGGIISFDFQAPVTLGSIQLLDVDDFGARGQYVTFTAWDADGNQVATTQFDHVALTAPDRVTNLSSQGITGDNSLYDFALGYSGVARLEVLYPGSGAIAGLQWSDDSDDSTEPTSVPEPRNTVSLLGLVALGAVEVTRRRSSREE